MAQRRPRRRRRAAPEVRAAAEALQVAQRGVADEHDVAAVAAVAAVGAAPGHVRLAAEADAAVAAGAGLDVDPRAIVHRVDAMADPVFLITGRLLGDRRRHRAGRREAGYRLVRAARSVDSLHELAAELGGAERSLEVTCDVTEWEPQQAMSSVALERFGRLDVVFADAGFGAERGFIKEHAEHWRSMVLTNVTASGATRVSVASRCDW